MSWGRRAFGSGVLLLSLLLSACSGESSPKADADGSTSVDTALMRGSTAMQDVGQACLGAPRGGSCSDAPEAATVCDELGSNSPVLANSRPTASASDAGTFPGVSVSCSWVALGNLKWSAIYSVRRRGTGANVFVDCSKNSKPQSCLQGPRGSVVQVMSPDPVYGIRQLNVASGDITVTAPGSGSELFLAQLTKAVGLGDTVEQAIGLAGQAVTSPTEPSAGSTASTGSSEPTQPARRATTISVNGSSGQSYEMTLWGDDRPADCAAHAYGRATVAYLKAHRCDSAVRRLATLTYRGKRVVVSMVMVRMGSYAEAAGLEALENGAGTGGMNDLLREGAVVPDAPSRIPASEVFWVSKEDASVWIYDAFYANGPTADQDPALLALVRDLYRTSFDSLP